MIIAGREISWNWIVYAALALLADPTLDALLAPPIAFEQLPAELPRVLRAGSGVLCQVVNY